MGLKFRLPWHSLYVDHLPKPSYQNFWTLTVLPTCTERIPQHTTHLQPSTSAFPISFNTNSNSSEVVLMYPICKAFRASSLTCKRSFDHFPFLQRSHFPICMVYRFMCVYSLVVSAVAGTTTTWEKRSVQTPKSLF